MFKEHFFLLIKHFLLLQQTTAFVFACTISDTAVNCEKSFPLKKSINWVYRNSSILQNIFFMILCGFQRIKHISIDETYGENIKNKGYCSKGLSEI